MTRKLLDVSWSSHFSVQLFLLAILLLSGAILATRQIAFPTRPHLKFGVGWAPVYELELLLMGAAES